MHKEGLVFPRLAMALSSLAPLFLLLIIRGDRNQVLPQHWLELICGTLIVLPALLVCLRFQVVRKNEETQKLILGKNEDRSIHVLTYLLMITLPLYQGPLEAIGDLVATGAVILIFVLISWRLNLHYLNIIAIGLGYRTFTVISPEDGNPSTRKDRFTLITKRKVLQRDKRYTAYRLSDTVYWEVG